MANKKSVWCENRILCQLKTGFSVQKKRIADPVLGNEKGHILFGYGLECFGFPVAGGVENIHEDAQLHVTMDAAHYSVSVNLRLLQPMPVRFFFVRNLLTL
jgi:hypothetical protein